MFTAQRQLLPDKKRRPASWKTPRTSRSLRIRCVPEDLLEVLERVRVLGLPDAAEEALGLEHGAGGGGGGRGERVRRRTEGSPTAREHTTDSGRDGIVFGRSMDQTDMYQSYKMVSFIPEHNICFN